MEIFVFECDLFIIGLDLGSHKMNEKKRTNMADWIVLRRCPDSPVLTEK